MKIIEGMKEIKRLEEKVADLTQKVEKYSCDMDFETPTYGTPEKQKAQVSEWLQSIHDSLKEALNLRIRITKTNLATQVTIQMADKAVDHSIAEWILRRRIMAALERDGWAKLGNKQLRVGVTQNSVGDKVEIKARYYFDPVERDKKVEEYRSEPLIVDRTLEVINATTDLVE